MSVTGIRALLEAAEYLKKEEIAKSRELHSNCVPREENYVSTNRVDESDNREMNVGSSEKAPVGQDREAHNRLEKDRRADLKARFEKLQNLVPSTKGKKCSNLSILRNAIRYIHSQTRLEREYVTRIQHLSHEKSQLDKNLERAWQRLSVRGVDLARVRRKVRSKLAQREKREESTLLDTDSFDESNHKDNDAKEKLLGERDSFNNGTLEPPNDGENRSRSISPNGSLGLPGSGEMSSVSEDEGSESTTTASECGSNILDCGEMTDEASECGEVVVQEGIVPSQSHTCVSLCPTPLSPTVQDATSACPSTVPSGFPLQYAVCNMSGSFASSTSGAGSEPQSGTSSDSGFSSGVNEEREVGEVKLPMKKRKLARSLVQDLTSNLIQDSMEVAAPATILKEHDVQPPEKKLAIASSASNQRWFKTLSSEKSHSDTGEKFISLITTLPSTCAPLPVSTISLPSPASLSTSAITSSNAMTMSASTPLSNSMPLLQRTLTDPRNPPSALVRHHSFESPENLNPTWMNQRIVPVYQLLSNANTASPPSISPPQPPPPPPAVSEKLSLVTHSPVSSFVKAAAPQPPTLAIPGANGGTHLVLPVIGPNDGLILRGLAAGGRQQPIVLMPISAGSPAAQTAPGPSLVPIQLVSDGVLSTVVNNKFDHP